MKQFEVVCSANMDGVFEQNCNKWFEIAQLHCSECYMSPIHPIVDGDIYKSSHEHRHIIGKLKSDNTAETIAKWFGIQPNNVQKLKMKFETCLVYISTHYGHIERGSLDLSGLLSYPYKSIDIREKISSLVQGYCEKEKEKDFIEHWVDRVQSGEYDEYTRIKDKFVDKMISKLGLKTKYDDAVKIARLRRLDELRKGGNKPMLVCWLYGDAGSGKTSFAKWFGKEQNKDIFISSSGSHPFDEYCGQNCVIIDDIGSDNGFDGKTLLKLLDINNPTFCACRYNNKFLNADILIVTASVSPELYWERVCGGTSANGNVYQLLRRLNGGVYHFSKDCSYISVQTYDGQGHKEHLFEVDIPQEVLDMVSGKKTENLVLDTLCNGLNLNVRISGINMNIEVDNK